MCGKKCKSDLAKYVFIGRYQGDSKTFAGIFNIFTFIEFMAVRNFKFCFRDFTLKHNKCLERVCCLLVQANFWRIYATLSLKSPFLSFSIPKFNMKNWVPPFLWKSLPPSLFPNSFLGPLLFKIWMGTCLNMPLHPKPF